MIASFRDKATEDIFNGVSSRIARKACPQAILSVATRKLDQLDSVESLDGLMNNLFIMMINNQTTLQVL